MTNAGWGGKGTKRWGLQRLIWTGEMPFETKTMRAKPDGFELTFTMPVNRQLAAAAERYEFESYTYKLESRYGGPEADKKKLTVRSVEVAADGHSIRLRVTPLRAGYVHELRLHGLVAADGTEMLHRVAYYTLVKVPK